MKLDRRSFLLSSAVAAAKLDAKAQERQEIRAAFVGTGNRGSSLLSETLEQHNIKVVAVCDTNPEARDKAATAASRHQPRSYSNWKQVVDLKDVDAVFVATPCDLHAEMAAACLDAGKFVYCEKPVGITPEQVAAVLGAARRSKAFLQIGQQLRYYPSVREAIRRIHEEKVVGQTFVVKAQRHSAPSRKRPSNRPSWYDDVRRSGDLIVENAVHNIDACNWIVGSRPVSAYGHGKKYLPQPIPAGTIMMDGFSVEYIYENDVHVDYSQLAFHARGLKELPNGMWYTVFGDKGSVFMTHESAVLYDLYGESEAKDLLTTELKEGKEDAVAQFFACIREKRQPFAGVQVAAVAALTAIMGREAIYRRRMVTWKELGVEV
jgi:predicted dehydrogenase